MYVAGKPGNLEILTFVLFFFLMKEQTVQGH